MTKTWWGEVLASIGLIAAIGAAYCTVKLIQPHYIDKIDITLRTPAKQEMQSTSLGLNRAAIGYLDLADGSAHCRALGDNAAAQRPTASLAKLITVQVVLAKHPLGATESGPNITLSADDEAHYWHEVQTGGSYGRVVAGEVITERQLIEGIMLASANNMADSLVIWAFGSLDNYRTAAVSWLKDNRLSSTTIGTDASGLDESTTSTPSDLCKIALLAAKQPALVSIMGESSATMPTGDVLASTNRLIGQDGVVGGKTGYTEAAGHGVVLIAHQQINHTAVITASVALGNDSYDGAFDAARRLNLATKNDIGVLRLAKKTQLGTLQSTWGSQTKLYLGQGLIMAYFVDQPPTASWSINQLDSIIAGQTIGSLEIGQKKLPIKATSAVNAPTWRYKLTH